MINLYNEDCLEGMKKIPDGSVDFILTDLPFGITDAPFDKRLPFEPMWEQFKRVAKLNAAICLFANGKFLIELAASNLKMYRYKWVWRKNLGTGFLNAKKMPLKAHEDILVFYRKLPTYNPQFTEGKPYSRQNNCDKKSIYGKKYVVSAYSVGSRYPRDTISFDNQHTLWGKPVKDYTGNGMQKPVALLEYLIKTYSNEGETVLDATMGSGSTGVACANTGRNFIGFETKTDFYEIAEKRINEALDNRGLFLLGE